MLKEGDYLHGERVKDGHGDAEDAVGERHRVVEPCLGDMAVLVERLQLLYEVDVVVDAEYVGVVEEIKEKSEEREQDQGDPVVAQEESQQGHFGVALN